MSTDLAAPDRTDGTTGLPRGAAWRARADALLRDGGRWVLLLVDLDRFARVDAAHGHLTADHVTGITASGGASTGPGLAALLWGADRALYAAKRAGGGAAAG